MSRLASLPPELFALILDCIPSIYLQQTTISLLRIFSYGRIPNWRRYLFYHIHLKWRDKIRMLDGHLQRTPSDSDFIKKISLDFGSPDAINVVLMIPKLEWLSLDISSDLEPEHLRHFFRKPMPKLRYLSLRFRPNALKPMCNKCDHCVETGYYDSILATLASWPSAELPAISVVQDPPGGSSWSSASLSHPVRAQAFAHLDNLQVLASSPLLRRTQALRLRIPGREFARFLSPRRRVPALPHITFLDLSTSRLSDSNVGNLLCNLSQLRHLIIDDCGLPDGTCAQDWAAFAHCCMLTRGDLDLEQSLNRKRSMMARGGTFGAEGSRPREARILPRAAALRTLSLSVPEHVDAEERLELLAAFRRGWAESLSVFNTAICAARRSRVEEGTVILRFPRPGEVVDELQGFQYLPEMVIVDDDEEFARLSGVRNTEDCPIVCLAGGGNRPSRGIEHAAGCGHSIWGNWEDT